MKVRRICKKILEHLQVFGKNVGSIEPLRILLVYSVRKFLRLWHMPVEIGTAFHCSAFDWGRTLSKEAPEPFTLYRNMSIVEGYE